MVGQEVEWLKRSTSQAAMISRSWVRAWLAAEFVVLYMTKIVRPPRAHKRTAYMVNTKRAKLIGNRYLYALKSHKS